MTEKDVLGRDELLNVLPKAEVHKKYIEALGKYVYMKEITQADQDAYDRSIIEFIDQPDGSVKAERNMENMRCKYLVHVLCDKKGRRLYSAEDAEKLGGTSGAGEKGKILRELYQKALETNGATREETEETEKNSRADQTGGSPSD